jgi:hypothetical protein
LRPLLKKRPDLIPEVYVEKVEEAPEEKKEVDDHFSNLQEGLGHLPPPTSNQKEESSFNKNIQIQDDDDAAEFGDEFTCVLSAREDRPLNLKVPDLNNKNQYPESSRVSKVKDLS